MNHMTKPAIDLDPLLHGGMRAAGELHERNLEEIYILAAKLVVNIEPGITEYAPNDDPLLNEMLLNAAHTAHERGLLDDEQWTTGE